MPINNSGPVSLGGSTTGQSINLELGLSATAQISINDAVVRTLLGRASGQISLNDAYGKSNLAAPTSLSAYPPFYESYNNLRVEWYLPPSSAGASVQVYLNGSLYTTTGPNAGYVDITGLTANTGYSIYVRAIRNGALSPVSSTVTGTTRPCYSYWQFIDSYCNEFASLIEVRGSGTCGYVHYTDTGNNVNICGYVPYGTLVGGYCSGNDVIGVYANGSGGTFDQLYQSCGNYSCCNGSCFAPPGQYLYEGCQSGHPTYIYATYYSDGCGGANAQLSYYDPRCGYSPPPPEVPPPTYQPPVAPPVAPPAGGGCIPPGGYDDTLGNTSCCSGVAVNGSTVCDDPADWGTTWASCYHICA